MALYVLYTFKTRTEKNTWLNWYMFVSLVSTFVLIKGRKPTQWKIICLSFQNVYLVKVGSTPLLLLFQMTWIILLTAMHWRVCIASVWRTPIYRTTPWNSGIQPLKIIYKHPVIHLLVTNSIVVSIVVFGDPFVRYQLNNSKYCGIWWSIC